MDGRRENKRKEETVLQGKQVGGGTSTWIILQPGGKFKPFGFQRIFTALAEKSGKETQESRVRHTPWKRK